MTKPNPMGSTFAERAAAAAGESSFTAPETDPQKAPPNTTFAERAKAAKKTSSKAVSEDDGAENKAVAKKSASKKS